MKLPAFNLSALLESLLFPCPVPIGPGLPEPPVKKVGRPVKVETAGARLVRPETNTWEWDIARSRPANTSADLTDLESAELEKRGLKNWTVNSRVKLARVQGQTIAEAAKAAGCGFSTAQKIYGALSKFEGK